MEYTYNNLIYAYIEEEDKLIEDFQAVSIRFWNEYPRMRLAYKSKKFLGIGYIVNYDIYGDLHIGEELCRFYASEKLHQRI